MSGAGDSNPFAYDQVPYSGNEDVNAHVRHLESLGALFGLRPASVRNCRVLEIGCASGRNLLPQALDLTDSRFVGVDLSADQINRARDVARRLRLDNIEFRHGSLEAIDDGWGRFDYILCPGVYSWITPPMQQLLLRVCKRNLAQRGIALVSYNTLPGWRFHGVARDIMRYHAGKYDDPSRQVLEARKLIRFMVEACPPDTCHAKFYREISEFLDRFDDSYVFHDYLVEDNHPVYFHQFVQRAEEEGLRFLSEAHFPNSVIDFMQETVRGVLARTPRVQREQFLDYLRNTAYRKSLLCHDDVTVPDSPPVDSVRSMHLALTQMPQPAEFDVATTAPVRFQLRYGQMTSAAPLGKAALRALIEARPGAVTLEELCDRSLELLPGGHPVRTRPRAELIDQLGFAMAACHGAGLVAVYQHPPSIATSVTDRPAASSLTRLYASEGEHVTSQRNEQVRLDPWERLILSRLDGEHDVTALARTVSEALAAGELELEEEQQTAVADDADRLAERVETTLCRLHLLGLLIA